MEQKPGVNSVKKNEVSFSARDLIKVSLGNVLVASTVRDDSTVVNPSMIRAAKRLESKEALL